MKSTHQIKKLPINRNELGEWTHPELPSFGEGITHSEIASWASSNKLSVEILFLYEDESLSEEVVDSFFDVKKPYNGFSFWEPKIPKAESFLLSLHDTEDGPVAWIATPTD